MASSSLLTIGVSALNAAQMGLQTAGHNIANANTPGFNRQEVLVGTRPALYTGAGYMGQGVEVNTVRRVYSQFLNGQVLSEQGQAAMLNTYYAQIQEINNVIADPNAGISPAIQDFFGAINNVAGAPESQPARQAMLNSANAMTARFQSLGQRFTDIYSSVNLQISNSVSLVNSYSQQIAALNKNIVAQQSANSQTPNDLLDQRDQLVAQLNTEIKTSVVKQNDGSYNIFVGNGQSLVVGTNVFSLDIVQSPTDPSKQDVVYTDMSGAQTTIQQSSLQGGNLGGFLTFRETTLTTSQNALGRVAMGIAGLVNEQHQLGQDLNGSMGGSFFTQPTPTVYANTKNSIPGTIIKASINNPADYASLTGSDYTLKYNGANFTLTRLFDNTVTTLIPGAPDANGVIQLSPAVDGLSLTATEGAIPGTVGAVIGDNFTIRPTVDASSTISVNITDPAKIAVGMPIRAKTAPNPDPNLGSGKISSVSVQGFTSSSVNGTLLASGQPDTTPSPAIIRFSGAPGTPASSFDVIDSTTQLPVVDPVLGVLQGLAFPPGVDININGWTTSLSGTPNPGDAYTFGPNINAVAGNTGIANFTSPVMAPVTLTYTLDPATNIGTFSGFPANLPVTLTDKGISTTFAAGAPVTYIPGATLSFGGVNVSIAGTPANNDTFTIEPNVNATSDSRNALLMANLQTKNTLGAPANGRAATMTFQGAYAQWVSDVGNKTRELQVTSTAQTAMAAQTVATQQSFSGVNLDEEAANLMRYQRAYQAAGKALQIGNSLFDTILSLGR
ncbi:MAG: flagellar hook-associated protein FlgK [Gallionellaceae bacterium]|jgi:flagellar hook-associated protein 1 FlgK